MGHVSTYLFGLRQRKLPDGTEPIVKELLRLIKLAGDRCARYEARLGLEALIRAKEEAVRSYCARLCCQ